MQTNHTKITTRMPVVRSSMILPPPVPSIAPETECAHPEVEVTYNDGNIETRRIFHRFDFLWSEDESEPVVSPHGMCTRCGVEVNG